MMLNRKPNYTTGILLLLMALLPLLPACNDRDGLDPRLDGMWQLQELDSVYYSFQVDMVNAKKIHGGSYYGMYRLAGDSIYLTFRETTAQKLKPLGLRDTLATFRIDKLTRKRLELTNQDGTLTFKKY